MRQINVIIVRSMEPKYKEVISLLRFFVETGRYSIVDRIAYATSPSAIRASLYEALRIVRSLKAGSLTARIRVGEDKIYDHIECCEYGEDLGYGVKGLVEEIYSGSKEYKGKTIYCAPCPGIPDEAELSDFLEESDRNTDVAKEIAILAHTYRSLR